MEIPPFPPSDEIEPFPETIQVWNLLFMNTGGITHSRPQVVNFSSYDNLKKHVVEMILKCERLDTRFRLSIDLLWKHGLDNFQRIVETFRMAQTENSVSVGFDIWWDEEPQVLL